MKLKIPPKVSFIIDILERNGYEAYAVGGCVRDSILAREPNDWDITTSARPEQVKACFRRTIDTGIQHGTVTVMLDGEGFEITTYRIDGKYSDGRHPDTVTFTPNLREDLMRRDFTINAMAYNEKEGLIDLFGGMSDLQKRTIRCVGDPDQRFDEDALRVMRAVRFAAQLGFRIHPETEAAVSRHAGHLKAVSAERIRVELMKLLVSPHPEMIGDLWRLGITAEILPEFDRMMETPQNTQWQTLSVGEHTIEALARVDADPRLRLTMLLHDAGKTEVRTTDEEGRDHFTGHAEKSAVLADGILRRLKFDNATRREVVKLIRWHMLYPETDAASVRHSLLLIGPESFESWLSVKWANVTAKNAADTGEILKWINNIHSRYQQIIRNGDCLSIRDLAITGDDLTEEGITGKAVGEALAAALYLVVDDPMKNNKETLMEFIRERGKKA